MFQFKTNTAQIQKLANQLEKMGKSQFPVTVRQTLNSAAFGMKNKKGLPKEFDSRFEKRPKTSVIILASKAIAAKGFDVKTMKSTLAVVDVKNSRGVSKDIAKQETGKSIRQSFVALPQARVSGSWNRQVQSKYRWEKVKARVNPRIRTDKRKFKKEAYYAKKTGKFIYYKDFIVEVTDITKGNVKLKFLYKKLDKRYNPEHKGFMKKAGLDQVTKMNKYFIGHAIKKMKN